VARRPLSLSVTFALAVALGLAPARAHADGVHIKVRGSASLEAYGVRADGGDLMVRGVVLDDARTPLSGAAVGLSLARASAPAAALSLDAARSCNGEAAAPHSAPDGVHLVADAAGRFCVRVVVPIDRYVARVRYGGSPFVDAAQLDVPIDLSRRTATLLFSPEPRVVHLDAPSIAFDAAAMLESDGVTTPGVGFGLTLSTDDARTVSAMATTDASGRARFTLPAAKLGGPGPGELRLAFAGNADAAAASSVTRIERHARVDLDIAEAQGGRLPPGSPEEGIALTVRAVTSAGSVGGGTVEARVGDTVVGAAPVEAGVAKLVVAFGLPESSGAADEVVLALRYLPSAPWFEAGDEPSWRLPVRGRSPLRQAWVLAAGVAVAVAFVAMRAQRASALAVLPPRPRATSRGEAKLDMVRLAGEGEGWKGRITDADDGMGVAAARVQIERPAFGRADVLASVLADSDGGFELPLVDRRVGDELSIEAPLHVTLRRPLPLPGELDAQLIQRRRALLGRLVAWARQRGRPFDVRPEPTPGHVRRAAGGSFDIVRWAEAVERAAFSGEPVDAHLEADIDRIAPGAPKPADLGPAAAAPREEGNRRALANPTKPNR
jgi:hypothetical protein